MAEAATSKSESHQEIVSFAIGDQGFCFDIRFVLEIRGWTPTTVLPHAPNYVKGLMNLRGTVLPVVDLSMRLGLGLTEPSARHVIIIVRISDQTVGFLVESVSDILTVDANDIKPTPDIDSSESKNFVRGVFSIEDELIRLIDVPATLPFLSGDTVSTSTSNSQ
jgi:purine-binding chemotaxis protein CheW